MTSAVTRQPLDLAHRMISTEPAVDTWQMCTAEPTCAASRQSRAMIASSATAGQPVRPSLADTSPSLTWAPAVSRGSWACCAITPSNALTYSSARRMSVASADALPVVGEHPDPGGRVRHRAEFGELAAAEPGRYRAHRMHVAVPGLPAEPPDLLDHASGVGDRLGVRHRVNRGEPSERGRRCSAGDGLGVFPARLAQVRVQVDQARQRDQPVGVDDGDLAGMVAVGLVAVGTA